MRTESIVENSDRHNINAALRAECKGLPRIPSELSDSELQGVVGGTKAIEILGFSFGVENPTTIG